MLGHAAGLHAPGRSDPGAAVAAAHHLLLAHGLGVDALRATVRPDAEVAITLNPYPVVTVGDREPRSGCGPAGRWRGQPPVVRRRAPGTYPDDVLHDFAAVSDLAHIHDGDLPRSPGPSTPWG